MMIPSAELFTQSLSVNNLQQRIVILPGKTDYFFNWDELLTLTIVRAN